MDINKDREMAKLISRAKHLRRKMETEPLTRSQLCELYGIYSILIRLNIISSD